MCPQFDCCTGNGEEEGDSWPWKIWTPWSNLRCKAQDSSGVMKSLTAGLRTWLKCICHTRLWYHQERCSQAWSTNSQSWLWGWCFLVDRTNWSQLAGENTSFCDSRLKWFSDASSRAIRSHCTWRHRSWPKMSCCHTLIHAVKICQSRGLCLNLLGVLDSALSTPSCWWISISFVHKLLIASNWTPWKQIPTHQLVSQCGT